MSVRLLRKQRAEIVKDFCLRHDGVYNPHTFVEEVRSTGPDHPAYQFFTWDDTEAANKQRTWEARMFVQGLKLVFQIEHQTPTGRIKIHERDVPLLLSPSSTRQDGMGYYMFDPNDPDHLEELRRQAVVDLKAWLVRYSVALDAAGLTAQPLERIISILESRPVSQQAAE
jgi:hypothetical protein